jgi:hypothetical protein
MQNPSEEFVRRSGHRFNLIIRALPKSETEAISMDILFEKLSKFGYKESLDQLAVDISALVRRGEVAFSLVSGKAMYWALEKGLFETRKRTALIKLHNMELTEEDLKALEGLAQKGRGKLE